MPEIRYYEVEQTRIVKVWANNEVDAAGIAASAFFSNQGVEHVVRPRVEGEALGSVVVTNMNISREIP